MRISIPINSPRRIWLTFLSRGLNFSQWTVDIACNIWVKILFAMLPWALVKMGYIDNLPIRLLFLKENCNYMNIFGRSYRKVIGWLVSVEPSTIAYICNISLVSWLRKFLSLWPIAHSSDLMKYPRMLKHSSSAKCDNKRGVCCILKSLNEICFPMQIVPWRTCVFRKAWKFRLHQ